MILRGYDDGDQFGFGRRCSNKGCAWRPRVLDINSFHALSCAPFVDNLARNFDSGGHAVSTYNLHSKGPHIGIQFWCGMSVSSDGKNITLLSSPPVGVFCARGARPQRSLTDCRAQTN